MIKARFGEANIQSCDVMLKDIIESKRVDRLIHNRTQNVFPLSASNDLDCTSKNTLPVLLATITG